jgi:hypothetical protein
MRAEERLAGRPSQKEWIKGTKESGWWPIGHGRAGDKVDESVWLLIEFGGDRTQAGTNVPKRKSGPLRHIPFIGVAVTGEVATGQLGHGHIALSRFGLAQPVTGQHIGMASADHGTPHGEATKRGSQQQMDEGLACGPASCPLQPFPKLLPGHRAVSAWSLDSPCAGPGEGSRGSSR